MNSKQNGSTLAKVSKKIESTLGLQFSVERWDILARNLAAAASDFDFQNVDKFIDWLLSTNLNNNQIETLAPYLTNTETFFWREPMVFEALINTIFPEIITPAKNKDKTIRIWSAGCSSGEEAYSLAIALHKAISTINNWNISILASDINSKALKKAKEGIYAPWSFRNCPPWLVKNYFKKNKKGHLEIIPTIREMVRFTKLNLIDDSYPSANNQTNSMDLIFCRNVLMYFSKNWITTISSRFYQSLKENGWFVVSSCELSSYTFPQFNPVNFPGAILYKKEKVSLKTSTQYKYNIPVNPTQNIYSKTKNTNTVQKYRIKSTPISKKTTVIPEETGKKEMTSANIRSLANQGNLSEALVACNEKIKYNKLKKELYFLKASILQELNQPENAITSLKQAIYLDPDFIMAHFVLGNLFLRSGQFKSAKKHLRNTLNLLEPLANNDIPPESEGLSVNYIREIIQANMKNLN